MPASPPGKAPAPFHLMAGFWPSMMGRLFIWWMRATGGWLRGHTNHAGPVQALVFSNDNRFLISGGADQKIRFQDVDTWKPFATYQGHEGSVWSLAVSPDGSRLASAGTDGVIKLWNSPAEPELGPLALSSPTRRQAAGVRQAAFCRVSVAGGCRQSRHPNSSVGGPVRPAARRLLPPRGRSARRHCGVARRPRRTHQG